MATPCSRVYAASRPLFIAMFISANVFHAREDHSHPACGIHHWRYYISNNGDKCMYVDNKSISTTPPQPSHAAGAGASRGVRCSLKMIINNVVGDTISVMTETHYKQLIKLDRKSAIVARGMVQHFVAEDEERSKLRVCQQAAIDWSVEAGSPVTGTSLTSKIGRLLRDAGVFMPFQGKPRHGQGYTLEIGPRYEEFVEFLDNHIEYGMLARGVEDSIKTRSRVLDQLQEAGAIMLDADEHRVDSKTYKALRDMLLEGKLKVVYVRPDTKVAVKAKGDTAAHRVDFWTGNGDD